jgi:branched-chain amino acid transport system substrate-binding protein
LEENSNEKNSPVLRSSLSPACYWRPAPWRYRRRAIKINQSPLPAANLRLALTSRTAPVTLEQLAGPLTELASVELAAYDDQANPDQVCCMIGPIRPLRLVTITWRANPLIRGLHLRPNVSPANTNPRVTDRGYPEVSRIVGRDDVQGVVAADFAASKGMTSTYVIHDKTAYGQGIADSSNKEPRKRA